MGHQPSSSFFFIDGVNDILIVTRRIKFGTNLIAQLRTADSDNLKDLHDAQLSDGAVLGVA